MLTVRGSARCQDQRIQSVLLQSLRYLARPIPPYPYRHLRQPAIRGAPAQPGQAPDHEEKRERDLILIDGNKAERIDLDMDGGLKLCPALNPKAD